jgi:hypothetical protein
VIQWNGLGWDLGPLDRNDLAYVILSIGGVWYWYCTIHNVDKIAEFKIHKLKNFDTSVVSV